MHHIIIFVSAKLWRKLLVENKSKTETSSENTREKCGNHSKSDKWRVKRKRDDGNLFNFLGILVVFVVPDSDVGRKRMSSIWPTLSLAPSSHCYHCTENETMTRKKNIYSFRLANVFEKKKQRAYRLECHPVCFTCRGKVLEVSFATQFETIKNSSHLVCSVGILEMNTQLPKFK